MESLFWTVDEIGKTLDIVTPLPGAPSIGWKRPASSWHPSSRVVTGSTALSPLSQRSMHRCNWKTSPTEAFMQNPRMDSETKNIGSYRAEARFVLARRIGRK